MKEYLVVVRADTNDGDYIEETKLASEDLVNIVQQVADKIAAFEPYKVNADNFEWEHTHNFPYGELVRDDLGELDAEKYYVGTGLISSGYFQVFLDFIPNSEFGIHSITSVTAYEVADKIEILK